MVQSSIKPNCSHTPYYGPVVRDSEELEC